MLGIQETIELVNEPAALKMTPPVERTPLTPQDLADREAQEALHTRNYTELINKTMRGH